MSDPSEIIDSKPRLLYRVTGVNAVLHRVKGTMAVPQMRSAAPPPPVITRRIRRGASFVSNNCSPKSRRNPGRKTHQTNSKWTPLSTGDARTTGEDGHAHAGRRTKNRHAASDELDDTATKAPTSWRRSPNTLASLRLGAKWPDEVTALE